MGQSSGAPPPQAGGNPAGGQHCSRGQTAGGSIEPGGAPSRGRIPPPPRTTGNVLCCVDIFISSPEMALLEAGKMTHKPVSSTNRSKNYFFF